MGTYNVPRDVSGEDRILFIFSRKALVYTIGAASAGLVFYFLFSILGMKMVGMAIMGFLAIIGFIIGTLKVPNMKKFEITRVNGGEKLDDVIRRAITFKKRGNRIYIYKEEETNDK